MTYTPGREERFEYIADIIAHIEETSCSKGCKVPDANDVAEFGPGGQCPILSRLYLELPVDELDDDGRDIVCQARQPLDHPTVDPFTVPLFEATPIAPPWDCRRQGHRVTEFYTRQEAIDLWGDHGGAIAACAECSFERRFDPAPQFWVNS